MASPPPGAGPAGVARGAGAGRAPRSRHRQRLGQLEQIVHVGRPRAARLLDQRPEDPLVARQRARVRRRRARARGRRAHLEHRDADLALRGPRERAREPRAVAVGLEEERDGADLLVLDERLEQRRRVEHGLVAHGRDRVEAQAAPHGQRVDRHVPALRDERDASRLPRHERIAPERGAGAERDQPVAVRPEHRPAARGVAQRVLERAAADLGEARGEDDRAAAPAGARRRHDLRDARGRDRHDHGIDRLRQVLERRHARPPVHRRPRRMHPVDGSGEPAGGQVAQRLIAVGARPLRRADDRHGARPQQRCQPQRRIGLHRTPRGAPVRAGRTRRGQRSTAATPRRSSERAMISRWISLVPSQIRSTRSSRRNRSATLSRR